VRLAAQEVAAVRNAEGASRAASPAVPLLRAIAQSDETPEGTRVRITTDAPLAGHNWRVEGGKLFVVITRTEASVIGASNLSGRGFTAVASEQRGADALIAFRLSTGVAPRVRAGYNRLDILFAAHAQQDSKPTGGGDNGGNNSAPTNVNNSSDASSKETASASPTPTPAANTSGTTTPENSAAAPAPAAANGSTGATAAAPATAAARYAALLTPEKANPVSVKRFETAPVIDGKLDEEVWKQAAVFKNFIQNRPGDLIAPSKQTEAMIGYDAKFLYVAFRAYDEPDKVRATVAKRDAVFDDDWVGVFLDTFDDGRRAYELIFNPLGVQADAIFTEGVNEDFSVDIVMDSKGSITPEGYVVEVAIPFKSLRYTAGKDKNWGVHFFRTIKRFNNEQSSWMPISRDNSSLLGQKGRLTGLEGISTERTLEIIPSLTISEQGQRVRTVSPHDVSTLPGGVDRGRFLNRPIETDLGLTAKFGLTPTVTLDFAYNPDFAQVEADATVVTANQRFPIFFEEKRPFFLEGKEIFETLISAVHTRTIVDPDYAAKLTGKIGRNTFGLLVASDNAPGNLSDEERDFILDTRNSVEDRNQLSKLLDRNATVAVLRLKRDVGRENHLGFLATSYNFIDKYNHVAGFDGRFRLNKTTTLTAQVLGSVTHRPFFYAEEGLTDDRKEQGMAYGVYLNNNGRNWGYELGAVGRSRFFRADVGFNRRFDTNNPTLFVRYNSTEKPKAKLVGWRVYNFTGSNFDWRGRHQRFVNESQLQLRLRRQTFLGYGFETGYERVFEDEFGSTREALLRLNRNEFEPLIGAGKVALLPACDQTGGLSPLIDDDPETEADEERSLRRCTFAGGDTERSVGRKTFYTYAETRPSKKYSFFVFTSYNWGVIDFDFGGGPRFPRVSPAALEFGSDAPRDPGPANEWFLESNVTYKPTDELNLQLYYTKDRLTRRDTGRLAFDDNIFSLRSTYQFTRFWFARARADYTTLGANVRAQLLLGWTPNPGTTFFVGYNDDLNRHGFNPFTGDAEPGFRRNGRLFFIKASYLFRRSIGN
jgi:hypothetical protein